MPGRSKAKQRRGEQPRPTEQPRPASALSTASTDTASMSSSPSSTPTASSSSSTPTPTAASPSSLSIYAPIEALKSKGNKAFEIGNYQRALDLYTQAIDEAATVTAAAAASLSPASPASSTANSASSSSSSTTSSSSSPAFPIHTLYSNRSAAHLSLKNYTAALSDAEAAIILAPSWPKGYVRKGQALEQLLRYHEAHRAYKQGLLLDPADPVLCKAAVELATLLEELKISEDELTTAATNPDSDRFAVMVNWLRQAGARFPKLYLQWYSEDYRGVHCLTKIPSEDIILFVPFSAVMTSQVAMDSELGQLIVQSRVELRSKHSYLASYLLQEREKGKDSYWHPYLACLPAFYHNMPIFFPPRLLAMLKGSFTLHKIQDRIDSLKTEYENIKAAVPQFARFSHDEFVWARLVVITRIFGLVIHGVKTDGLVPYADMLNHKKPRDAADTDTKWTFDDALNGFTIISLKTIQRGEQVFDSYGRKCNSRFFVNYGFALEDNEDDNEAVLRFQPRPHLDPAYATKLRMLHPAHAFTLNREFQVPASYRETSDREKKSREMFSYLRLVVAVDSELIVMGGGTEDRLKLEDIEPVSVRNEREVLRMIRAAAEQALAAFDQTLEDDEEILRAELHSRFSNERNCVLMRRGEKQVLRWYVRLADVCIELLSKPWKDIKRQLLRSHQSASPLDFYISTVIEPLFKKQL